MAILPDGLPYPFDLDFSTQDSGILLNLCHSALKTVDGGQSWIEIQSYFSALKMDFTDANTAYFIFGDDGGGCSSPVISKTNDFGLTIDTITSNVTLDYLSDVDFTSRSTGFIVGGYYTPGKVLKTSDGYHWDIILEMAFHLNDPDTFLFCCDFIDDNTGYALGNNQIWHTTDGGFSWTGSGIITSNLLTDLYFFNSDTGYVIGYRLQSPGDVFVEVYRLTGENIRSMQLMKQQSGTYKFTFAAIDLSAGIYLCRLNVNGSVLTKKLAVIH
jgi:hypothetical protein